MQVVKRLNCGVDVVSMTVPEFDACMNYTLVNGKDYPLNILGLDPDKIDEQAVTGYNSLINSGAFDIGDDGYPELMDAVPTVSNLVISLDEMTFITTIKAIVGKNHIQFYWIHGKTTWVIMWKTRTEWYVCSAPADYMPSTVFMELTKTVTRNLGKASVGFSFTWFSMKGEQMMSTIMRSKSDVIFIEKKPENPVLALMIKKWPNRMSLADFAERAGSLLEVI